MEFDTLRMKPSSEVYFAWISQVSSHSLIQPEFSKYYFGRHERASVEAGSERV